MLEINSRRDNNLLQQQQKQQSSERSATNILLSPRASAMPALISSFQAKRASINSNSIVNQQQPLSDLLSASTRRGSLRVLETLPTSTTNATATTAGGGIGGGLQFSSPTSLSQISSMNNILFSMRKFEESSPSSFFTKQNALNHHNFIESANTVVSPSANVTVTAAAPQLNLFFRSPKNKSNTSQNNTLETIPSSQRFQQPSSQSSSREQFSNNIKGKNKQINLNTFSEDGFPRTQTEKHLQNLMQNTQQNQNISLSTKLTSSSINKQMGSLNKKILGEMLTGTIIQESTTKKTKETTTQQQQSLQEQSKSPPPPQHFASVDTQLISTRSYPSQQSIKRWQNTSVITEQLQPTSSSIEIPLLSSHRSKVAATIASPKVAGTTTGINTHIHRPLMHSNSNKTVGETTTAGFSSPKSSQLKKLFTTSTQFSQLHSHQSATQQSQMISQQHSPRSFYHPFENIITKENQQLNHLKRNDVINNQIFLTNVNKFNMISQSTVTSPNSTKQQSPVKNHHTSLEWEQIMNTSLQSQLDSLVPSAKNQQSKKLQVEEEQQIMHMESQQQQLTSQEMNELRILERRKTLELEVDGYFRSKNYLSSSKKSLLGGVKTPFSRQNVLFEYGQPLKKANSLRQQQKISVENAELVQGIIHDYQSKPSHKRKKRGQFAPSNLIAKGRGELSGIIAQELIARKANGIAAAMNESDQFSSSLIGKKNGNVNDEVFDVTKEKVKLQKYFLDASIPIERKRENFKEIQALYSLESRLVSETVAREISQFLITLKGFFLKIDPIPLQSARHLRRFAEVIPGTNGMPSMSHRASLLRVGKSLPLTKNAAGGDDNEKDDEDDDDHDDDDDGGESRMYSKEIFSKHAITLPNEYMFATARTSHKKSTWANKTSTLADEGN